MMYPKHPATVERLSNGEYHIRWWQVQADGSLDTIGFTGGAAQIMIMLTRVLFEDEANETIRNKRAESDAIGARVLSDMAANPDKFIAKKGEAP